MADKKITDFPNLPSAANNAKLYIVENGIDYHINKSDLFSSLYLGVFNDENDLTTAHPNPIKNSFAFVVHSSFSFYEIGVYLDVNGWYFETYNYDALQQIIVDLGNKKSLIGTTTGNDTNFPISVASGGYQSIVGVDFVTVNNVLVPNLLNDQVSSISFFADKISFIRQNGRVNFVFENPTTVSGQKQILLQNDNGTLALTKNITTAIDNLKDGVSSDGNTLQKLYNLIATNTSQDVVADISARDAYIIPRVPFSLFVTDDGDGRWATYIATTTGVNAIFVKTSDPDLLNAVMSNAAIKTAYESNADTNALTNALKNAYDLAVTNSHTHTNKAILDLISEPFTTSLLNYLLNISAGATVNLPDAALLSRANHTGTQLASTISDLTAAVNALANRTIYVNTNKIDTLTAGGTTEQTVLSFLIPANTVNLDNFVELIFSTLRSATGYVYTTRMYLGLTLNARTTLVRHYNVNSNNYSLGIRTILRLNNSGVLSFSNPNLTSNQVDLGDVPFATSPPTSVAFNHNVDNYVTVTIQNSTGAVVSSLTHIVAKIF